MVLPAFRATGHHTYIHYNRKPSGVALTAFRVPIWARSISRSSWPWKGFKLGYQHRFCVILILFWVILTQIPGHTDPEISQAPRHPDVGQFWLLLLAFISIFFLQSTKSLYYYWFCNWMNLEPWTLTLNLLGFTMTSTHCFNSSWHHQQKITAFRHALLVE